MAVLVLNTHEAIKRLVKSGQDEKSAEAIVELITDVHEQVATRQEMKILETKIGMLQWMVGLNLAMTAGVLMALIGMN
ncbi:MAG: hypothetical protein AAFZ15_24830 [Bacteroidota bacterium]